VDDGAEGRTGYLAYRCPQDAHVACSVTSAFNFATPCCNSVGHMWM
jgi:hypothetical protein